MVLLYRVKNKNKCYKKVYLPRLYPFVILFILFLRDILSQFGTSNINETPSSPAVMTFLN